jgi:tetratricopeptide (TPR) repeat protein
MYSKGSLGARCAVLVSLAVLALADHPAEARRYGRRVRRQDECRITTSPSQGDSDKAKRYYESGVIYYDTKDYAKARTEFQSAYDISKDPEFLINLSAVASKQKLYKDAIGFLEQYIDECPNAPDTFSARQRVDDLRIAEAIEEGEKPPLVKRRRLPVPALALMGGGLGVLIVGIGLGAGALADAGQIQSPTNQNLVFDSGLQAVETRGKVLEATAITLDVVGGLAIAAGAIWTGVFYQRRDGLTLSLAPQPGGALVLGRF